MTYPHTFVLNGPTIGHWATVVKEVAVHAQPNTSSKVITKLSMVTGDGTQNIVLILAGESLTPSTTWYHVRLAILPNNSTGWVPASSLGNLYVVHTHLYVNREAHTATLKKDGRVIFTTPVGNGLAPNITPAGQFYVHVSHGGNDLRYAARVRHEREIGDADRQLAGRRVRRNPRHQPALPDSRLHLAWLHPATRRSDREAGQADDRRYAGHRHLAPTRRQDLRSTTGRCRWPGVPCRRGGRGQAVVAPRRGSCAACSRSARRGSRHPGRCGARLERAPPHRRCSGPA